jgi:hypothetical protein
MHTIAHKENIGPTVMCMDAGCGDEHMPKGGLCCTNGDVISRCFGGGPYDIKTFKQGERIIWERWEDFWGDYLYWQKPLYDASAVYGYADRGLAHPILEYGAHFTDLNRIVLKK